MMAALGKPAGMDWNGDLEAMARKLVFDQHQSALGDILRECARAKMRARCAKKFQPSSGSGSTGSTTRCIRRMRRRSSAPASTTFWPSIIDGIHLFKGVSDTTMIHGQGWQFIRLGRYLERAYATATLLEVYQPELFQRTARSTPATSILNWWACCAVALRLKPTARCTPPISRPIAFWNFCCSIGTFPHAIRYCVDGMRHAIEAIQRTGGRRPPDELTAGIGRLHAMLGYTTIDEILAGDAAAFLHTIREQCMRIHELIYRYYVQYSIQSALAV